MGVCFGSAQVVVNGCFCEQILFLSNLKAAEPQNICSTKVNNTDKVQRTEIVYVRIFIFRCAAPFARISAHKLQI